jgi:hypothetical protein
MSMWRTRHDLVLIGTEDGEALADRMPELQLKGDLLALVEHRRDGFKISLSNVPAEVTVGLHYIVAENENPEPVESSGWYAVDLPHNQLLKQEARR